MEDWNKEMDSESSDNEKGTKRPVAYDTKCTLKLEY
jgi:hypothetical protein